MLETVLASNNPGKLQEMEELLAGTQIQLKPQALLQVPEVEETGLCFVENAIIKARNACKVTGMPSIADDSGLAVDALDGAPGIYSSRYAGEYADDESNLRKLLAALVGVVEQERTARYYCAVVYMAHALDPVPIICQASLYGRILEQPKGSHGFGYDPLFYLEDRKCTVAELQPEEKNNISHRAKAVKQLVSVLTKQLAR